MDTAGVRSSMAKRPSRSNSTSSSVATVKKASSIVTKSSRRTSTLKPRSSTSELFPVQPSSQFLAYDHVASGRKGSVDGTANSPNRNINRWSHSTTSSTSAAENDHVAGRAHEAKRRLSVGSPQRTAATPVRALNVPSAASQLLSSYNGVNGNSSRSPYREQPPRIELPIAMNSGSNSAAQSRRARSPHTPSTAATTPKAGNSNADYFGESWGFHRSGRPHSPGRTDASTKSADKSRANGTTSASTTHNGVDRLGGLDVRQAEQQRSRSHRSPAQKTMLSEALSKANTAVMLDNVQDIDGAIEAYAEACDLLHQVMARSSDRDDRKKLSAIRATYSNRIAELHDLDDSFVDLMDKALPDEPPLDEPQTYYKNVLANGVPRETSVVDTLENVRIPPRQESLLPQIFGGESFLPDSSAPSKRTLTQNTLSVPMDSQYMPPPLSPRRGPAAKADESAGALSDNATAHQDLNAEHLRRGSTESSSWLNTFDESSSSARSSRLPSIDLHRLDDRTEGLGLETDYDSSWDAAVDAAYDDEIVTDATPKQQNKQITAPQVDLPTGSLSGNSHIAQLIAETSATEPSTDNEQQDEESFITQEYADSEAEEEALLDEMTKGFAFGDFTFDKHSKSALPRQSSSSTVSGKTWSSSIPSTTATNATTLSTLAEAIEVTPGEKQAVQVSEEFEALPSPPAPEPPPKDDSVSRIAPILALPQVSSRPTSVEQPFAASGLRDRRMSGQSPRQLTIETFARSRSTSRKPGSITSSASETQSQGQPGPGAVPLNGFKTSPSFLSGQTHPQTPSHAIHPNANHSGTPDAAAPALGITRSNQNNGTIPASPAQVTKAPTTLSSLSRRNQSSSSLKARNLSTTTLDVLESPSTPNSAMFPPPDSRKFVPPMPATMAAHFDLHGSVMGGMYLFDHLSAPSTPSSVKGPNGDPNDLAPQPLEPCPESFLLRPFWLMRCLYNAIAHPRGGYLTSRMFVPRDIWRVRNVKLKVIDDKIFQCDLLSAALLKIGKVDNLDADAVLIELQAFETVLDQVRSNLQKKLGTDVGVQGSSNIFRASATGDDGMEAISKSSSNNSSSKFASTFRKLRSKSSSTAMSNGYSTGTSKEPSGFTMQSLPMTASTTTSARSQPAIRPRAPIPSPAQLTNISPLHASYMSSLARLFDAAQVLDSVARQVVDPGLKCSNQTMVGLELSVRSAAEFFAFYVVRFVMADISLLVDKFIKRGTEWVLA